MAESLLYAQYSAGQNVQLAKSWSNSVMWDILKTVFYVPGFVASIDVVVYLRTNRIL